MTKRRNLRRRTLRHSSRSLHHETLEKRELLAAEFGVESGPRLISVAANAGEQFDSNGNNLLSVSPSELTFRFDGGQEIDPATLSAFRFIASGGDGGFTEGNEIEIQPGFIGLDDKLANRDRAGSPRTCRMTNTDLEIAGYDDSDLGFARRRAAEHRRRCVFTGPIPAIPIAPRKRS